jgi:hypothetical protein
MEHQQITWGEATMLLDNEDFVKGYACGRMHYFHGTGLESVDSRPTLPVSALMRVITIPDEDGYAHFDDDEIEVTGGVEETLGALVGYLSGLLCKETLEERQQWEGTLVREE